MYVSIGPYCEASEELKKHNLYKLSFPFDWIFSSLEIIYDCIEDKFNKFLDKSLYIDGNKHLIYNNMLNTNILIKHHENYGNFNYKPSDGLFINHHNFNNEDDYNKYVRRCNRLINYIENKENIIFFYYNPYTKEYNDLIEFSKLIEKYENIKIIGIYKKLNESTIIKFKNLTIYNSTPEF
jgi:hypothetical protein